MAANRELDSLLMQWRDACFQFLPGQAEGLATFFRSELLGRTKEVEIDDLFEAIDTGVASLHLPQGETVPVRRRLSELALSYRPSNGEADIEIDFDPFSNDSWNDEESLVAALFAMAEPGEREAAILGGANIFGDSKVNVVPAAPKRPERKQESAPAPWEIRETRKGFSLRQGMGMVHRVEMETDRVKADAALCVYVAAASLYRLMEPNPQRIRLWGQEDNRLEMEAESRFRKEEE